MTPAILHWCVISESLRKKCVFVCRNMFCTFLHFACALENKSVWIVIQCWFPKSNIVDLYNHHWIWQSAQCKYKGFKGFNTPTIITIPEFCLSNLAQKYCRFFGVWETQRGRVSLAVRCARLKKERNAWSTQFPPKVSFFLPATHFPSPFLSIFPSVFHRVYRGADLWCCPVSDGVGPARKSDLLRDYRHRRQREQH